MNGHIELTITIWGGYYCLMQRPNIFIHSIFYEQPINKWKANCNEKTRIWCKPISKFTFGIWFDVAKPQKRRQGMDRKWRRCRMEAIEDGTRGVCVCVYVSTLSEWKEWLMQPTICRPGLRVKAFCWRKLDYEV